MKIGKLLAAICVMGSLAGTLPGCTPLTPEQDEALTESVQRDLDSMHVYHDSYTDSRGLTTDTETICSLSGCSSTPE